MPSVTQGLCVLSQGCWSTTEFLHLHCPGLLCAFQLPPACPHQNEDEQHHYHRKVCHTPDVSSEHLCARTHFVLTAVPRGRALLAPLYRERHVICPSSSWNPDPGLFPSVLPCRPPGWMSSSEAFSEREKASVSFQMGYFTNPPLVTLFLRTCRKFERQRGVCVQKRSSSSWRDGS